MRVACLNQDPGVAPDRAKGAAAHLFHMRRAFRSQGAEVLAVDEARAERAEELLRAHHARAPLQLLYERYALGRATGSRLARELGVPHVVELNAPLADEAVRYRAARVDESALAEEREVFRHAKGVVAVSEEVARYALQRGAPESVVRVAPNGVDPGLFRPRSSLDPLRRELVPPGRFVLGFHGRLRPWHGFELLVEAARALHERGLAIHLMVVGEGEFESCLEGRLPPELWTTLGWQAPEEVARYVPLFDGLPLTYGPTAPSYFSPLKLAEAMACGVVPVVPSGGAWCETIEDGRNGLIYPRGSLEDLVESLELLILDRGRRRRLAARARATVLDHSWDAIARGVLERLVPTGGSV